MKLRIYYVEANNQLQYIEAWSTGIETARQDFLAAHPDAKAGFLVQIEEFALLTDPAEK